MFAVKRNSNILLNRNRHVSCGTTLIICAITFYESKFFQNLFEWNLRQNSARLNWISRWRCFWNVWSIVVDNFPTIHHFKNVKSFIFILNFGGSVENSRSWDIILLLEFWCYQVPNLTRPEAIFFLWINWILTIKKRHQFYMVRISSLFQIVQLEITWVFFYVFNIKQTTLKYLFHEEKKIKTLLIQIQSSILTKEFLKPVYNIF